MPKPTKKKADKRSIKKQNWCMMVIRASVPIKDIKKLKIYRVLAQDSDGWKYDLEIVNAYYDYKDQPDAMPQS